MSRAAHSFRLEKLLLVRNSTLVTRVTLYHTKAAHDLLLLAVLDEAGQVYAEHLQAPQDGYRLYRMVWSDYCRHTSAESEAMVTT
jgi:hypothetical protein